MKRLGTAGAFGVWLAAAVLLASAGGAMAQSAGVSGLAVTSSDFGVRGFTECAADLELSFSMQGRIDQSFADEGSVVAAGDPLMALDQEVERLDVERRRLQWESRAEVMAAQVRAETAQAQFEAASALYQKSGGLSFEEVQNREMAFKLASADLERLKASEEMERLDYETAAENLKRRTLVAPSPGIVTELVRQVGESAQANDPVLRLCDLSRIVFVANVPVTLAEKITQGAEVPLRVGSAGIAVEGRVRFVSPVVNSASGLREVKVDLIDPPSSVRPGLSAVLALQ